MTASPSPPAPDGDESDDERLAASRRAGAAARDLIGLMVGSNASTDVLDEVADALEAVNDRLRPYRVSSRFEGTAGLSIMALGSGERERLFEHHPFAGRSNPLAPPLLMEETDDGLVAATVTYDHRHEGMPNMVHGGVLAAAFDLVCAAAATRAASRPAPTGRLTIRYRIPTPLHRELRYEGRLAKHEGRKIVTIGTVSVDGEVTAEAEGLFIMARTETLPYVGQADA